MPDADLARLGWSATFVPAKGTGAEAGAVGQTVSTALSGELNTVGGGQGDATFVTRAHPGRRRGKG